MSVLKKTVLLCVLAAAVVVAQGQGAKVFPPTADQKAEIHKKLAELSARIAALGSNKADPQLLADVQIYKKAVEYILRFPDEFFGPNYAAETITALDTGIGRAIELENGTSSWTKKTGNVVRGFVSRIDGGVQPYGLTIPASYDGKRPMRLDIWLHGTQQQLNEVRFLQQQAGPHETSQILADDYIMVEPFARMNHSYKFYAETDVYEVVAAVRKHYNIDAERIVIRGHSMGGHQGSGRLALQNPTFFGAYEASAGYSETKEYAGNRLPKEGLTPYQEAALHYVDAEDYALNAFNVPGVSYGGEKDAQLRASTRFREAIVREGFQLTKESPYKWTTKDLRLLFLVGPDTGHAWHKESKAESEAFLRKALDETAGKAPNHVRFVTYTTKYNNAHWMTIELLEESYKRADVDARRSDDMKQYTVTTKNVARVRFDVPAASFTIDGQSLKAGANAVFVKTGGKWAVATGQPAGSAEDPRAAGADRGRIHRRVSCGARHGPAVERRRSELRESALRQLQVRVREMDARRHTDEGRQVGVGGRYRQLQPGPVRRSRQQRFDSQSARRIANPMDEERHHGRRAEVSVCRPRAGPDLPESAESAEVRRHQHRPDVFGEPDDVGNGVGLLSTTRRLRGAHNRRRDEDSRLLR